jgi:hypothetical protein
MEMDKTHMNTHGCRDVERAIAPNGKTAKGSHPINLGVRVELSSVIRFSQRHLEAHMLGFDLD